MTKKNKKKKTADLLLPPNLLLSWLRLQDVRLPDGVEGAALPAEVSEALLLVVPVHLCDGRYGKVTRRGLEIPEPSSRRKAFDLGGQAQDEHGEALHDGGVLVQQQRQPRQVAFLQPTMMILKFKKKTFSSAYLVSQLESDLVNLHGEVVLQHLGFPLEEIHYVLGQAFFRAVLFCPAAPLGLQSQHGQVVKRSGFLDARHGP